MSYALRNLVDASTLPRREKAIAREIAYYLRDEDAGRVACSVAQLVRRSAYGERAVRMALDALTARGVLSVLEKHTPGRPRTYRFHAAAIPRAGYRPTQIDLFPKAANDA